MNDQANAVLLRRSAGLFLHVSCSLTWKAISSRSDIPRRSFNGNNMNAVSSAQAGIPARVPDKRPSARGAAGDSAVTAAYPQRTSRWACLAARMDAAGVLPVPPDRGARRVGADWYLAGRRCPRGSCSPLHAGAGQVHEQRRRGRAQDREGARRRGEYARPGGPGGSYPPPAGMPDPSPKRRVHRRSYATWARLGGGQQLLPGTAGRRPPQRGPPRNALRTSYEPNLPRDGPRCTG